MEITNRIREFFGLHPDLIECEAVEVPAVALTSDEDSWTLVGYPADAFSPADREWLWSQLAEQAAIVLAREVPEVRCRIISPAVFPDGTAVEGLIQYVFPPPDVGFVQRYWWGKICEQTPLISSLLAQKVEQRWRGRNIQRAQALRRNPTGPGQRTQRMSSPPPRPRGPRR